MAQSGAGASYNNPLKKFKYGHWCLLPLVERMRGSG